MTGPAASLADRFQRAAEDVIEFVKGLSDDQWRAVNAAEGLSIGAMVHHLARRRRVKACWLSSGPARARRRPPAVITYLISPLA